MSPIVRSANRSTPRCRLSPRVPRIAIASTASRWDAQGCTCTNRPRGGSFCRNLRRAQNSWLGCPEPLGCRLDAVFHAVSPRVFHPCPGKSRASRSMPRDRRRRARLPIQGDTSGTGLMKATKLLQRRRDLHPDLLALGRSPDTPLRRHPWQTTRLCMYGIASVAKSAMSIAPGGLWAFSVIVVVTSTTSPGPTPSQSKPG
jgi:hypothetical protein